MNKRRSLTPSTGLPTVGGTHAMRRGGTRHTVSEKVLFRPIQASQASGPASGSAEASGASPVVREAREGWALNVSRGGLRAILEEDTGKIELGEEYDVGVGESEPRRARIVWLQEEPDGFVVGVEFVGYSETMRAADAADAAAGAKKTEP